MMHRPTTNRRAVLEARIAELERFVAEVTARLAAARAEPAEIDQIVELELSSTELCSQLARLHAEMPDAHGDRP